MPATTYRDFLGMRASDVHRMADDGQEHALELALASSGTATSSPGRSARMSAPKPSSTR